MSVIKWTEEGKKELRRIVKIASDISASWLQDLLAQHPDYGVTNDDLISCEIIHEKYDLPSGPRFGVSPRSDGKAECRFAVVFNFKEINEVSDLLRHLRSNGSLSRVSRAYLWNAFNGALDGSAADAIMLYQDPGKAAKLFIVFSAKLPKNSIEVIL